jgi:hypothetical protein
MAPPTSPSKTSNPSSGVAPKPAPSKLDSHEAYTANVKTSYGTEQDELYDVQRLTPMPANSSPELVYLGIVKGGKKAAFLLPGDVAVKLKLSASGKCFPTLADCQVVELGVGGKITLDPAAGQPGVSIFALTLKRIGAATKSSSSDATATRKSASAAGQQVVAGSSSTELADFFYDVSLGALVYKKQSVGTGPTGTTGATGVS